MITFESKVASAKEAAIKALSVRDLTRTELVEYLVSRHHGADAVEAALAQLEDLGLVDDKRVAEVFVRARMAEGPVSRVMVEASLLERGVEAGLVSSVLHEALEGKDEDNEALELARLRVRTSPAKLSPDTIRRRVFGYLVRRGFDEGIARAAVERAAEEYLGRP